MQIQTTSAVHVPGVLDTLTAFSVFPEEVKIVLLSLSSKRDIIKLTVYFFGHS